MSGPRIDLLLIAPGAPLDWPGEWPEGVGIVARIEDGRLQSLTHYHRDEDVDTALMRAAGNARRDEMGVSPSTPGWSESGTDGKEMDTALQAIALAVTRDAETLESAHDFAMNYEYAKTEGKAIHLPRPEPGQIDENPEGETPEIDDGPEFPGFSTLDQVRVVDRVTISRGVSGQPVIEIPNGRGARELSSQEVAVSPFGALAIHVGDGTALPATLVLPRRAFEIAAGLVPATDLRAQRVGEWLTLHRHGQPASVSVDVRAARRMPRFLIWAVLAVGLALALASSLSIEPQLSELLRHAGSWISGMDTQPADPVTELRKGLFAPAGG